METVACEQQSDDQSVYTTDGITYTMPVLYGHNGAVDNTQTPKIYAFNTLEISSLQVTHKITVRTHSRAKISHAVLGLSFSYRGSQPPLLENSVVNTNAAPVNTNAAPVEVTQVC